MKNPKTVRDYTGTVEGYKQFRNRVDEILLHFDFQKVHDIMEKLNWWWASWEDEEGNIHDTGEVPSVFALKQKAYRILLDAVEKGYGGTGGFEVTCRVLDLIDDDGVPFGPDDPDDFEHSVSLGLKFVLEEYGTV